MPKVNLLPRDRAAKNKARQGWIGAAFAVIAFIAVLGLSFAWFKGQEVSAQDELDRQIAANQQLQAEIAALAPYAELSRKYDQGADMVRHALANDVAWGRLLGDFGRMISDKRVWMEGLTVQAIAPAEETPSVYGAVAMNGKGFDYPDVSSWLLTLDSQDWDSVTGSWAGTVNQESEEDASLVTWDLTTSITEGAKSDRIETLIPEVPE